MPLLADIGLKFERTEMQIIRWKWGVSMKDRRIPTTPACTWWNRPEEDNSSGKLESTHPSRTSVKSDQGFFGVESVMRVNADSLLIRAAATSPSGTLNDLTTDLIMANNNNNNRRISEELRNLVRVEAITTVIRSGRLRWYGHMM